MSHFTLLKSKMTRKSCIAKALVGMGFTEAQIEVFDKPETLKMYHGGAAAEKGEIRIKGAGWAGQNHLGGYYNDMGFERQADGTYNFHCPDHDTSKYNKAWVDKLNVQYGKAVVHEIATEQNYFIESEEEVDGELVIRLTTPW